MWLHTLVLFNLIYFSLGSVFSESSEEDYKQIHECKLSAYPPDPDSMCCGVDSTSSDRIVGGEEPNLRQYPWLALIDYKYKATGVISPRCGGALISGRYVVTAAHCITGSVSIPISVRLGVHDKTVRRRYCVTLPGGQKDCIPTPVSISIEKVEYHAAFNDNSEEKANDIALIRLKHMVNYTDEIRPICLPKKDISRKPPTNLRFYAAGWGTMAQKLNHYGKYNEIGSNLKLHVDLPYKNMTDCIKTWGALDKTRQICAGGEAGRDVCMGDSGGPLMHDNDGIYDIIGLVSFGASNPCGRKNYPGVYTNVYAFKQWIKRRIWIDEKINKRKGKQHSKSKGTRIKLPFYRYRFNSNL